MTKTRILIIDDEPAIASVLQPVLAATGSEVFCAGTAAEGLKLAKEKAIDIILLDLGLPDADGKDLVPHLRSLGDVSIIVISARNQEAEKVEALDQGADDYVDKPFSIKELMARVRAAQRRLIPYNVEDFRSSELRINFTKRRVWLLNEEIRLSPKEYEILALLAQQCGRVVTHRRLLLAGWSDPEADPQYLRSYIALLRQKLEEDPSEPRLLLTEPGVGYRLEVMPIAI